VRGRFVVKVGLRESQTIARLEAANGGLAATLSDGSKVRADHVLLATGYKVDLNRLA
jgi:pyruvate/2-oxoglutarate dehydrogenase complex dihydrolipoamide dehydrogenase (E3) component